MSTGFKFGRRGLMLKRTAGLVLAAVIAFSGVLGFGGAINVNAASEEDAAGIVYKVEKGDTLEAIANDFSVTVDEIVAANSLANNDYIIPGQELKIPGQTPRLRSDDVSDRGGDTAASTTTTVSTASNPKAGMLSLNMVNMDIRDILSAIAMSMDVNIVYLGDPVTASLKVDNVSPTKALELLVQSLNTASGTMGYLSDGNIIIVGSQTKLQKDFFNKMALTRFHVNYISPDVLSAQLDKLGIPVQKITLDKSSKYIWAQGLPMSLTKVAEVIAALDKAENFDTDTSNLKASFTLAQYNLDYITADKLNDLIQQLALKVRTITVETNPKMLWANGTAQDLKDLDQLIAKVDIPESAGEEFDMEACRLTFLTYNRLLPIISQLDLPVQVIRVGTSQKALWLKGTLKDIADLKDLIAKVDIKDNGEEYQYFVYTLKNVSPADEAAKLDFLAIGDVKAMPLNYPNLSHELLIRCPQDMISTVREVLFNTDIPGKKIKVPVDSSTAQNGAYFLNNRKALLNKLLGIPLSNMFVSDNVSKTTEPYFVLWVDETPDNVKLIRSMIEQIDAPK